jgi:membrane peptidoglycan carboxypeptidase
MNHGKSRVFVFIIILIIIVLAVVSIYFYLKPKQNIPIQLSPLTEEQKINILDKLGEGADISPEGIKKQEETLKQLNGGKAETKPLTNEERQKLLNSIQ